MTVDYEKNSVEWRQGYKDYENGLPESACPYEDEHKLEAWYEGWTWAHDRGYFGDKSE